MNVRTANSTATPLHVEACCSTGTSPGRSGTVALDLPLSHGGTVRASVGFEIHGPAHAHPIVVLGGISADRHLRPSALDARPGWWPRVVAPGGALDPERQRLIGFDYVGGNAAPLQDAPSVSTRDQACALATVLDHLGVDRVTLVGSSYGGMVALAFASLFPLRAARLVVVCAAHRSHPMATGLRSVQRRAVRLGCEVGRSSDGVAIARSLAMTTYRSATEFEARFEAGPSGVDQGRVRFPVESYLQARGDDFARGFDASAFLTLSESIDTHEVVPSTIEAPTTLVSFDTDTLVPPWLVSELADRAPGVDVHLELRSHFGHDAFLKEVELMSNVIGAALRGDEAHR